MKTPRSRMETATLTVQFWFLHVKTGNISKAHNLIGRFKTSPVNVLNIFFKMSDVEKRRAVLAVCCLNNLYGFNALLQTFLNFLIM